LASRDKNTKIYWQRLKAPKPPHKNVSLGVDAITSERKANTQSKPLNKKYKVKPKSSVFSSTVPRLHYLGGVMKGTKDVPGPGEYVGTAPWRSSAAPKLLIKMPQESVKYGPVLRTKTAVKVGPGSYNTTNQYSFPKGIALYRAPFTTTEARFHRYLGTESQNSRRNDTPLLLKTMRALTQRSMAAVSNN